jgi:DNA-binding transcriptional LysR family regulator
MTIQQCKYVLGIARNGSFNEAAKQLFVAQSSLSTSIKQLEQELNIKLFERTSNGVFLSPEGAEFVRYAEQLVEQNEFIMRRYQGTGEQRRLYISTQHYDFIADAFCKLIDKSGDGYEFALREIATYEVIREVETSYCDIGIIAIKDGDAELMNRYLAGKGIRFTELFCAPPHVFVRRAHSIAQNNCISYEDLKNFPYVSYDQGSHNTSLFTEELTDKLRTDTQIKISDRATLMNVLLTTDCYTVGTGIMPSALIFSARAALSWNRISFLGVPAGKKILSAKPKEALVSCVKKRLPETYTSG